MSRTEFARKNVTFGLIAKILTLVINFISRTIFIRVLGNEALGVNSLYTELLTVLSFAELGFASALIFAMYKPVADNDEEKVIKLLYFYKRVYHIIAFAITLIGLSLLPFLQYIVRGASNISLFYLRIYFLIFLFNSVIGYFVSYKLSYLNALQKKYIETNVNLVLHFLSSVVQIAVLLLFQDFLVYLISNSLMLLTSRVLLALYLNRKYPILTKRPTVPLSKEEKIPIYKEVKGLAVHQFASVAVHSTDNIIISSLTGLGVVAVGFVSNYNLIINSVLGFVVIVFSSLTSGFGNLVASSTVSNYRRVFRITDFLSSWIYGFCSVAFYVLIPPFIKLWLGSDYLIDNGSFLLIVLSNYLLGKAQVYNNARIAKGDFNRDKWVALAQALVNLIVSVIGAYYLGLIGVFIGTIVSRLINIIFKPYLTYSFLFAKPCKEYYYSMLTQSFVIILSGLITYYLVQFLFHEVSVYSFVISVLIVAIVPNIVFVCAFFRTQEFKESIAIIASVLYRSKR